MSFEVVFDRKQLLEGLRCVEIAVERKTALLQLFKFVRLNIHPDGQVLLQTMNQGVSCDYLFNEPLKLQQAIPDNTAGLIEHAKLYHIISKSKREQIRMDWEPGISLTIHAEGKSTLQFLNIASYEMQPTDDITTVRENVPPELLAAIWNSLEFMISPDPTHYAFHGLFYDGSWVASTGSQVAIYNESKPATEAMPIDPAAPETERQAEEIMFIPPPFESFIKLVGSPSLKISKLKMKRRKDKHLVMTVYCEYGKLRYLISLNNWKFPDWRNIEAGIRERCKNQLFLPRAAFLDALERASVFIDSLNRFIVLDIAADSPQHILLTARTTDTGEKTVEQIPIVRSPQVSEALHMCLSYDTLRKICDANEEELIDFRYADLRTPAMLIMAGKEYLVAPMMVVER